jgi:hypothetical protein
MKIKKVQKTKGFRRCKNLSACLSRCSARPPRRPLGTHSRTLLIRVQRSPLWSWTTVSANTLYARFVLKTVQFIGASLPYPLSAALILLFEGVSGRGPQDKSDLWLAQGTLWSLRSLITAAYPRGRAPCLRVVAGYYTCKSTAARVFIICIVCVSRWVLQKCGRRRRRFMAFSLNHWPV